MKLHVTTQTDLTNLLAVASLYTNDFLNRYIYSAIGTRLSDTLLGIAMALQLGSPFCEPHTYICGTTLDLSYAH